MTRLLYILFLAFAALIAPAHAQTTRAVGSPIVWTQGEPFSLELLATRAAPVLWLSPGEPVTDGLSDLPTTAASVRNCADPPPDRREASIPRQQLFYRIDSVRLLEDLPMPEGRSVRVPVDQLLKERRTSKADREWAVDDFRTLTIRYMLYFPCDKGVNGHDHDLENVLIRIEILEDRDLRLSARIVSVTGMAHGVDNYANQLLVETLDDVVYPIHMLVEEGKHALAPDRDANGLFSPDSDVNVGARDAWGIYDPLAEAKFPFRPRKDTNKQREPATQVWPAGRGHALEYDLRAARASDFCKMSEGAGSQGTLPKALLRFTNKHHFCQASIDVEKRPGSYFDRFYVLELKEEENRSRFGSALRSFTYRYEGGPLRGPNLAWTAIVTEKNRYWMTMRLNTSLHNWSRRGFSEEWLFMPTAAGIVEPYGLVGTWHGTVDKPVKNTSLTNPELDAKLITETGVKVRFKAEFLPFLGIKIGARWLNFRQRGFVVEVGPAPF